MIKHRLRFVLLLAAVALVACGNQARPSSPPPPKAGVPWWNDRVFYEVFVRSFQDSDGDGIGDLAGLVERLDYLNDGDPKGGDDLGVTDSGLSLRSSPLEPGSYRVQDLLSEAKGANLAVGDKGAFSDYVPLPTLQPNQSSVLQLN